MRFSVWSSFYIDLKPFDALMRLAKLGCRDVEISAEHGLFATTVDRPDERLEDIRKFCEDNGITLWQMHAPLDLDVASQVQERRNKDIRTAVDWIGYASILKIPNLVIHPGGALGARSKEEESFIFDLNCEAFSYLAEVAKSNNVNLCIENMQEKQGRDPRRFGAFITDINELIKTIGASYIGICFDTSHANVTGLDPEIAIEQCADKLLATHISDNDGSSDQHKIPFNGNIDWFKVVSSLKSIGYKAAFNLEIPGEIRFAGHSSLLPLEVRDAKIRYAMELFDYMLSNYSPL